MTLAQVHTASSDRHGTGTLRALVLNGRGALTSKPFLSHLKEGERSLRDPCPDDKSPSDLLMASSRKPAGLAALASAQPRALRSTVVPLPAASTSLASSPPTLPAAAEAAGLDLGP